MFTETITRSIIYNSSIANYKLHVECIKDDIIYFQNATFPKSIYIDQSFVEYTFQENINISAVNEESKIVSCVINVDSNNDNNKCKFELQLDSCATEITIVDPQNISFVIKKDIPLTENDMLPLKIHGEYGTYRLHNSTNENGDAKYIKMNWNAKSKKKYIHDIQDITIVTPRTLQPKSFSKQQVEDFFKNNPKQDVFFNEKVLQHTITPDTFSFIY